MGFDMKKTILISISTIVAVCSILIVYRFSTQKPVGLDTNEVLTPNKTQQLKEWINNSIDDVPPGYVPRYQWADDTERAQLESAWANAATNLMHGTIQGMKECVATVSERMKSIAPEQFCEIINPCYSFLKGEFLDGIVSRSYADTNEFYNIVLIDIAGMNVLGDIELASALVPRQCAYLEADALAMARKAVKKFSEDGREDFVSIAKEIEELIIRQIESENGLVRRYMNADLKMQMLLYERGYSTRENVIRGVRTDAWHLENTAGYVPKWLDEFK